MKCTKCGADLGETAAFCYKCGMPVAAPEPETAADPACPKCGTTLSPGQQFCHKCGAAASVGAAPANDPAPKKERKPLPKKVLAGIIVLAAAIVIAAAIVLPLELPRYNAIAHNWMSYISGEKLYVSNERGDAVAFDRENTSLSMRSADGSIATVVERSDDSSGYTLYMVRGGEKTEIADNVIDHIISDRGDVIVYFEKASDNFDTARMMRYLTASGESQPVDSRIDAKSIDYTVLSPDGRSIAYVVKMEGSDATSRCNIDGESVTLRGNSVPVGISDGGRYIYYVEKADGEYKLYVTDGKDETLLHEEDDFTDLTGLIYFNADMSQLLYSTSKGTYISDGGKPSVLLDNRQMTALVCPTNMLLGGSSLYGTSFQISVRCGVSSLYNKTYIVDNSFCWLDSDGLHKIAYGSNAQLSKRLDVMVFLRDDKLFIASPGRNGANTVKQLSDDEDSVYGFMLSADGAHVYYTDENDTLWYVPTSNPQKTKLIAYGVSGYDMAFSGTSNNLWFIADGDMLFVSTGGGAKKIVSDKIADIDAYDTALRFIGTTYDIEIYDDDDDNDFNFGNNEGNVTITSVYDVYGPRGIGIELIIDAVDADLWAEPAYEAPIAAEAPAEESGY